MGTRGVAVRRGTSLFPVAEPWWKHLREASYVSRRFVVKSWDSDGTDTDIQDIHDNDAANGDTITIPDGAGTPFSWSTGLTITKAIHLQGAGAGRVVARSNSSVAVGTGAKVFTLETETVASIEALKAAIVDGVTLTIERPGTAVSAGMPTGDRTWMKGTVTSLVGTTLTMNITSVAGSGTHPVWIVSTEAATIVEKDNGSSLLVSITASAAGHVEISGIRGIYSATASGRWMQWGSAGGLPIKLHDCYFELNGTSCTTVWSTAGPGLVWNCSFTGFPFFNSAQPFIIINSGTWESPSTMGTADTTGILNFYIEDCDFHAVNNSTDLEDAAVAVIRYNLFNNSGIGTHGADSSNVGVRHYEIYGNAFRFNGYGSGQTLNLTYFMYLRGGTGTIHDNDVDDIQSGDYSSKPEVLVNVQNLRRSGGPHGCWGAGDPGVQYPAPRQFGMGHVTGLAGSDVFAYNGDVEPCYFSGNTGAAGPTLAPSLQDYSPNECGVDVDTITDYVIEDRDYILGAKPSYTEFEYPHPLREGSAPPSPPMEPEFTVDPVVTGTPEVGETLTTDDGTATGSPAPTFTYQWYRCTTP